MIGFGFDTIIRLFIFGNPFLDAVGGDVRAYIFVYQRRVRFQGLLQISHNGQRVIIDVHVIQGIFRNIAIFGHDDGYGLAYITNRVFRQDGMCAFMKDQPFNGRGRNVKRPFSPIVSQIFGRVDGDDPILLQRPRFVDTGDTGMSIWATDKGRVGHIRQLNVVDE
jgi:hypothetical protein